MKGVLRSLFTDTTGMFSCRLVFGSIGFVACIIGMFFQIVDVSKLAIIAPLSATLMGLSVIKDVKYKEKEE